MKRHMRLAYIWFGFCLSLAFGANAAIQVPTASYPVEVIKVIDGDSFVVRIALWPQMEIVTTVRVAEIDTPELRGKCETERKLAKHAERFSRRWLDKGQVFITNVKNDKYGNRVVAHVTRSDQTTLAEALLSASLAQPYPQKNKQKAWCP